MKTKKKLFDHLSLDILYDRMFAQLAIFLPSVLLAPLSLKTHMGGHMLTLEEEM